MKKSYVKPTVEKLGSFESVTKAGATGAATDFPFPSGTPFANQTFS